MTIKDVFVKHKEKIFIGGVFLFFLFTMLYNLTHSALWYDEWIEWYYSQTAITTGAMYKKIISTFQPPLYNFVMHFWLKISESHFWFRFFNVVLGMISAVFLFLTQKRLYNKKVACFTLVILAMSYQWIYCIQECSEYALMLTCIFGALYFYVEQGYKFAYWKMCAFILACVAAIYSQYGSVFVVIPLLALFYFHNVLSKDVEVKKKAIITVSYVIAFIGFAIPLIKFFLLKQMDNNGIGNVDIPFTLATFKNLPFTLGRIWGYFYHENDEMWQTFWGVVSILIIVAAVIVVIKGKMTWEKKSLIFTLGIGYVLHYVLVEKCIYAMVHAGSSAGYYSRYSYFYIPIMAVVLPIIFAELYKTVFDIKKLYPVFAGALVICSLISFYDLLGNWHKAYDDVFAEIWVENEGWKDQTYLIGCTYGFYHYGALTEGCKPEYLYNATTGLWAPRLPTRFWLWRTNFDHYDSYDTMIWTADRLGFTIEEYVDAGYSGQLAYCHLDNCELIEQEDIEVQVIDTCIKDGILYITVKQTDSDIRLFNQYRYQLAANLYYEDGSILQLDCSRLEPSVFITDECYVLEVDTNNLGVTSFDVQLDVMTPEETWFSQDENEVELLPILEVRNGVVVN